MDNNNLFNNTNTDPAGEPVNPTAEPAPAPAVNPTAEPAPAPIAQTAPAAEPASAAEPAPIADSAPAANPAPDPQPAPAYGSYTAQPQAPARPDFSQYQNAGAHYTSIPRETVYINNQQSEPAVRKKKEKARIGVGAVALIVAVCMIFSGGAAFIGTYAANRITNQPSSGNPSISTGTPSVIFQAQSNQNKAPGTYTQVAEAVAPTVVEIVTESVVTASLWGGSYVTSGAGSGVIISSNGLIITNNHVVSGAETIKVTLKDGTEYTAKLLGTDSDSDIAVIKVEAENLPCALVGSSEDIAVGQEVIAVGNPLGEFGGSVTNGIISALSREITIDGVTMTLLQTNAAVNPGNSGGGLFNLYGELIGIVNAKSSTTSSGTAVEGIGFAIPINDATKVATELVNYGYVKGKPYLGINIVDVTTAMEAYQYGVNQLGLYIRSSEFTEELKSGDRIIGIDNKEVTYSTDLKAALRSYKVGDEVTLTVVRKGQYVEVKVTLHEYVPATADQSGFEKNADKNLQN